MFLPPYLLKDNGDTRLFLFQQIPVFTKGDEFEPTAIEVGSLTNLMIWWLMHVAKL